MLPPVTTAPRLETEGNSVPHVGVRADLNSGDGNTFSCEGDFFSSSFPGTVFQPQQTRNNDSEKTQISVGQKPWLLEAAFHREGLRRERGEKGGLGCVGGRVQDRGRRLGALAPGALRTHCP